MSKNDNTYITKVGFRQSSSETDTFFIEDDSIFEFYDTNGKVTTTGAKVKNQLYIGNNIQIIANSAGVLSTINIPINAGTVIFSIGDAASNGSAWLTSGPIEGQDLEMFFRGVGSTGSIYISMSGVSLVGTISGDLSSISLQNSAVGLALSGSGYIKLKATSDGEWSIVSKSQGGIVERASA